jgi:hypothetical protein
MATELIVRVESTRLAPVTALDQEHLEAMGLGSDWLGRFVSARPRSIQQNKFYWAMLGKIVQNHPFYRRAEQLHLWVKLRLGYVEEIRFHDGDAHWRVSSTSFQRMPSREFKTFLDAAIDVLCNEVIPGLARRDLVNEIESMLHISYDSLWAGEGSKNGASAEGT